MNYPEDQNIPHTKTFVCGVCGGHQGLQQGIGIRCFGYTRGGKIYCTREQYGGSADQYGQVWLHFVNNCKCGNTHKNIDYGFVESIPTTKPKPVTKTKNTTVEFALRSFSEAKYIYDTDSEKYLAFERSLDLEKLDKEYLDKSLRHHPELYNSETGLKMPAFLQAQRDTAFRITGIQAIYLDGYRKVEANLRV